MKQRSALKIACYSAIAGLLVASSASAAITLELKDNNYNDNSNGGGEFGAIVTGANFITHYSTLAQVAGGFSTFCLEYNEHIAYNTPYNTTVSSGAVKGGVSGNNPDTISKGTAWLYYQFAKGTLAGYNYSTTLAARQASSKLLQEAIWYLEGEIGLTASAYHAANKTVYDGYAYTSGSNLFLDAVVATYGSIANAQADYTSGLVVVLNPMQGNTYIQSQLAVVPEPSTIVAGALLLLPFATGIVRSLRKKSQI